MEIMKCPDCGAPLHFEEGQEYCYCSHCGTQVDKEDIHFDKRIDFEKYKLKKEVEDRQKERESSYEMKKIIVIFSVLLVVLAMGMLMLMMIGR